jgi:hypothetical protein
MRKIELMKTSLWIFLRAKLHYPGFCEIRLCFGLLWIGFLFFTFYFWTPLTWKILMW